MAEGVDWDWLLSPQRWEDACLRLFLPEIRRGRFISLHLRAALPGKRHVTFSRAAPQYSWPSSSALISQLFKTQGLIICNYIQTFGAALEVTQQLLWQWTNYLLWGLTLRTPGSRYVEPRAGQAAWPWKGNREDRGCQPNSLTLESIVSCGLGKAGGRDHRALKLEEIFVTCYLREENERLGRQRTLPLAIQQIVPGLLIVITVVECSRYARHGANALNPLLI